VDRRSALVTLFSPALAALWRRAAAGAPSMRITRIDTVYWRGGTTRPFWPTGPGCASTPTPASWASARPTPATRPRPPWCTATWRSGSSARPAGRRSDLEPSSSGSSTTRSAVDRDAVLSAVDLALLGPPRPGARRARLAADRRAHEPAGAGLQHLFSPAARLQRRAEKIMREVKERYGITGIKIWPFDGARTAAGTSTSRPTRWTARSCRCGACATRSGRNRDHARAPLQLEPSVGPCGSPGRWSLTGRCGSRTCSSPGA